MNRDCPDVPGGFSAGTIDLPIEMVQKEVEESVIDDIRRRRNMGRVKYGATMERTDLSLGDFLREAYHECLDQAIYLKRAMRDHAQKTFPVLPEDFRDDV